MEHGAIIISLFYVGGIIKDTHGLVCLCADNWQSILLSCMILPSKVWDGLSMWNVDFSNMTHLSTLSLSTFTLQRINN
jgi:hypothetical protein